MEGRLLQKNLKKNIEVTFIAKQEHNPFKPPFVIGEECRKRGVDSYDFIEWATGKRYTELFSKQWAGEAICNLGIKHNGDHWFELLNTLLDEWEASGRTIPNKRMVITEKRKKRIKINIALDFD